jgi:hypothetical protein
MHREQPACILVLHLGPDGLLSVAVLCQGAVRLHSMKQAPSSYWIFRAQEGQAGWTELHQVTSSACPRILTVY